MHSVSKKRSLTFIATTLFALLILSISLAFRTNANAAADPSHQVLPANDGWAAASGGTTGGSAAAAANVYTVTTRAQLVTALGGAKSTSTTPKIIYINGVIYGNQSDSGSTLTCSSYVTGGYSLSAYLAAYDPAVWGAQKYQVAPRKPLVPPQRPIRPHVLRSMFHRTRQSLATPGHA